MTDRADTAAAELVEAARALSRLDLVTAFGHVSARSGDTMTITPATDLALLTEASLLTVPLDATELPAGVPAEAWAHLALYRARRDAAAIARAQPPAAYAAAAAAELAGRAAADLPRGEALLLRGKASTEED
jgi:HCOMODA/2-hydroxy-3-carboxy-muconic semialdehyde decarboxylase